MMRAWTFTCNNGHRYRHCLIDTTSTFLLHVFGKLGANTHDSKKKKRRNTHEPKFGCVGNTRVWLAQVVAISSFEYHIENRCGLKKKMLNCEQMLSFDLLQHFFSTFFNSIFFFYTECLNYRLEQRVHKQTKNNNYTDHIRPHYFPASLAHI